MEKIILVVPCFNEEIRFEAEYFSKILEQDGVEILFVNDGSTDKTASIIEKFCAEHKSLTDFVDLPKNRGKANAVRAGVNLALSSGTGYVGFIDADGAFPIHVVKQGVNSVRKLGMAHNSYWFSRVMLAGSKIERNHSRHYVGRILITLLTINLKNCPYDTQAGFKIFTNNLSTSKIFLEPFRTSWLFDIEIFLRMIKNGLDKEIKEIPVEAWKDVAGSKIQMRNSIKILREVLIIWSIRKKLLLKP
jgi:dolichyl-phosphate beta-glucosyltransferase